MKPSVGEKNHFIQFMRTVEERPETIKLLFYRRKKSIFTYFYTFIQFPLKNSNLSSGGNAPPFKELLTPTHQDYVLKILKRFQRIQNLSGLLPCIPARMCCFQGAEKAPGKSYPCDSQGLQAACPENTEHRTVALNAHQPTLELLNNCSCAPEVNGRGRMEGRVIGRKSSMWKWATSCQ